jgi:hypothetical protein
MAIYFVVLPLRERGRMYYFVAVMVTDILE